MYGLLIEAIVHYIKANFGEAMWLDVRRLANIQQVSFATHELYRYTQYTLFMTTLVLIYQMFNVQQIKTKMSNIVLCICLFLKLVRYKIESTYI